ncbi:MAG: aminotransferase class [Gemmatimonadetes bacterium]|nr:aminotransferase class [Gemmatimonadota bacterium]
MTRTSRVAQGLIDSKILTIAAEVRALVAEGKEVCNLTVGDFGQGEFHVPALLSSGIAAAVAAGETNYPPPNGMPALRQAIVDFTHRRLGITVPLNGVLVSAGSRPIIYAAYRVIVDPGDRVVYPLPSWNNNCYVQLVGGVPVEVPCAPESGFLPVRAQLEAAVRGARLLVLNSPMNPAGTMLGEEQLAGICDLVLEENARRGEGERPLYLLYDQVYWMLTFGGAKHVHPVALRPAMAPYTVTVDGISKAFAATGLRVGWALGPADLIGPMADTLTHVGAWAPRPEQVATTALLGDDAAIDAFHDEMRREVQLRLELLHRGIEALCREGFPVSAVAPQGAMYLTARFALHGRTTAGGDKLVTDEDVRRYLLHEAGMAGVPFGAFGFTADEGWFRLSVGAVSVGALEKMLGRLGRAMGRLTEADILSAAKTPL